LDAACPALTAAEGWSVELMRNVTDAVVAHDGLVDAARTALNALLSDVEERRAWAGAEHAVRERAAALNAACVAAHAALQARDETAEAPEAEAEVEDEWEEALATKKRRNKGGGRKKSGRK
jgi:uncharacterized protein YmfQ (DUF2313 family)